MGEFLSADLPLRTVQELVLSKDTLKRAGDFRFDVVTRSSLASTTFAKGYGVKGHFRGSGPVVLLDAATLQPAQHDPHLLASGVAGSAARGALGHGAAGELAPKRACLTTPRQGTDDKFRSAAEFVRLWRNEVLRVFYDQLISDGDKEFVEHRLAEVVQEKCGAQPGLADAVHTRVVVHGTRGAV